jgi:MYXO-CTERM domain-containing protein
MFTVTRAHRIGLMLSLAAVAACGGGENESPDLGRSRQMLAEDGPWHIPPETLAIGDTQFVAYTSGGDWVGESGCYGGISPGTALLRDYLYAYFPQTYHIGGYACRPIVGAPTKMSVHATGRALDVMIATDDGEADNDAGDPIGNWLIENSEAIGISLIIWDLYSWGAHRDVGEKGRDYGGAHPHHDHLHVELSVDKADLEELWFLDLVDPPVIPGCETVPPSGGVIEETDACFGAFGPAEYWRTEEGVGSDDAMLWTNAFENDEPSNWARWNVYVEESGRYQLEVFVDPAWGVNPETHYRIAHADGDESVYVDQSLSEGWVDLGEYELSTESPTWVDVYDNVLGPVADDSHIAVDALRLTRLDVEPPPETEPPPEDPPTEPEPESTVTISGSGEASCSASGAPARTPGWAWLAFAGLAVATTRRRRRC